MDPWASTSVGIAYLGPKTVDMAMLSIKDRLEGTYVAGVTGTGKSTLLTSMVGADLHYGRGCCVIDPHGDLIEDVLGRLSHTPERAADVRLLDLQSREVAFGLNLFWCPDPADASRTAERVVAVFKKVWGEGSWGPRLEDLLANAAFTLVANPGATLADLPRLLTDSATRKRLVRRLPPGVVRDYWELEYDQMKPGMQQQVYGPLMNKARAFLRDPLLHAVVSQRENSLDLRQAIEERRIVLVRLDADREEATALLGGILLQQLMGVGFARRDMSPEQRTPFMVYFDEAHLFATPTFVKLMREVRKFGIGITAATQIHSALPEDVGTVFSGSATMVCFRLTDRDARLLQGRFTGTSLERQANYDPDPLGTLLSKGHADTRLVDKARDVERMLAHWQSQTDLALKRKSQRYHSVTSLTSVLKRFRLAIDAFLFDAMVGADTNASTGEVMAAADVEPLYRLDRPVSLEPVWELGIALVTHPIFTSAASDRGLVVSTLTHLPVFRALMSYQRGGQPTEAILQTVGRIEPLDGWTFRPRPLGIKRESPKPPPPPPTDIVFFRDPAAPPPFLEPD